eukprot:1390561-Amphidinium_carterae.2
MLHTCLHTCPPLNAYAVRRLVILAVVLSFARLSLGKCAEDTLSAFGPLVFSTSACKVCGQRSRGRIRGLTLPCFAALGSDLCVRSEGTAKSPKEELSCWADLESKETLSAMRKFRMQYDGQQKRLVGTTNEDAEAHGTLLIV